MSVHETVRAVSGIVPKSSCVSWKGVGAVSGELSSLQATFRSAMAGVCTPVSVVTTVEDGRPHGTTVSAFTSLSMAPPMVLVSLDAGSDLLRMVRRTGTFGINVLSSGQSELAIRFAKKGPDKFASVDWSSHHGSARLTGSATWVACSVAEVVAGGDHLILLGDVVAVDTAPAEPLTYHGRTFGTHLRHAEAA
jgi:flavin reductase (DIM6/NTAB) family NADH-FMN oxidoreductase RutF